MQKLSRSTSSARRLHRSDSIGNRRPSYANLTDNQVAEYSHDTVELGSMQTIQTIVASGKQERLPEKGIQVMKDITQWTHI